MTATVDDFIDAGLMFAGTPDMVYDQIKDFYDTVGGFGHLPDEGATPLVFVHHDSGWPARTGHPVTLQQREEQILFFAMVTLISEVLYNIQSFFQGLVGHFFPSLQVFCRFVRRSGPAH